MKGKIIIIEGTDCTGKIVAGPLLCKKEICKSFF